MRQPQVDIEVRFLIILAVFLFGGCSGQETCGPYGDDIRPYRGYMFTVPGNGASHIKIYGTIYALSLHDQDKYNGKFGKMIDKELEKSKFSNSFVLSKIDADIYFKLNHKGRCSFHLRNLKEIDIINDEKIIVDEYLNFFNNKPF